jgi:hypothetical protein
MPGVKYFYSHGTDTPSVLRLRCYGEDVDCVPLGIALLSRPVRSRGSDHALLGLQQKILEYSRSRCCVSPNSPGSPKIHTAIQLANYVFAVHLFMNYVGRLSFVRVSDNGLSTYHLQHKVLRWQVLQCCPPSPPVVNLWSKTA